MSGTITIDDIWTLAEEYGVPVESVSRGTDWGIEYGWGDVETYSTGEEACEAVRAYGAGSR